MRCGVACVSAAGVCCALRCCGASAGNNANQLLSASSPAMIADLFGAFVRFVWSGITIPSSHLRRWFTRVCSGRVLSALAQLDAETRLSATLDLGTPMNQIDEIAHVIQLSVAPVFLLTGLATLIGVLSGRLSRIVDRSRVIEMQLETCKPSLKQFHNEELNGLERRGKLIYRAITLSTLAALMVCVVIVLLFGSAMLHHVSRMLVAGLFIVAMLASIASLVFFLREVFLAIETFRIGLAQEDKKKGSDGESLQHSA